MLVFWLFFWPILQLFKSAFHKKKKQHNWSSLRRPNQAFTPAYPVLLPNYAVWNIKLDHCLNDLQIQILFFEDKIDILRKPPCEGKLQYQLGRGKNHSDKISDKAVRIGPGAMMLLFSMKVSSASSLLGCLPRELLVMTRLLGRLFN